jgi:hypothetical protein
MWVDQRMTEVDGVVLLTGVGVVSRGVRVLGTEAFLADGGAGEADGGGGGRSGREAVEELRTAGGIGENES